jgi:O-methyltransferase involved in polyketide biosynthesis
MTNALHDTPPPENAWLEAAALGELDAAPSRRALAGLDPVASTLAIPLAARALGDRWFPRWAVGDVHAERVLTGLGIDPGPLVAHRPSVFGVLSRTRCFRERASAFFARHPRALGVALGAGLSHYFQWLDTGANVWIDADLPEVTQLRQRWLPATPVRRINAAVDVSAPGWWQQLALPEGSYGEPQLLLAEGLVMYLEPAQVRALLWAVGQFAPPGSRLLLDAMAWPAVGRAARHPAVRHTGAEFRFGVRRIEELAAAHPRLRLDAIHPVMEPYGLPYNLLGPLMRVCLAVPAYAIYELGVDA